MGSSCPICFEDFEGKIRASPDTCDHVFCLPCLEKWSKLGSYCPVDRKRYKKILNLDSEDVIQVKPRKRKKTRTVYDFTTKCEICLKDDGANVLLLCDSCDLGYHIYCLSPPLKEVPSGLWFCSTCISIEEKLKKKNGITKEVEAEFGGVDKELINNEVQKEFNREKKSKTELKSVNCKNDSILEACHDIISEFEDIDIKRSCSKNVSNSDILDESIEIDKIYKTFDFSTASCSGEHSKQYKTYSVPYTLRKKRNKTLKPFTIDQIKRTLCGELKNSKTNDLCLKKSVSCDIDLLDHYLTESVQFGYMKSDAFHDDGIDLCGTKVQKCNINIENNQDEPCSVTNCLQSENLYESHIEDPSKKNYQDLNIPNEENFENDVIEKLSVNENNSQDICEKTTEASSPEKEVQRINKSVITSDADDFVSSCNSGCQSDGSYKGTCNNLISEFLNENIEEKKEEKKQFSIFERIEGIDASQRIYCQFIPFSSEFNIQQCFLCKDEVFARSQKHCKICKLKYCKNPVKYSEFLKKSKKTVDYKWFDSYRGNSSVMLDTQKYMKNTTSVLERRKRSLVHKLQKIRDSKLKVVIPTN